MKTEFNARFLKDIDKLKQKSVKQDVIAIIEHIELTVNITEINNLKKLKGYKIAYRIRSGDYRIGLFIENDIVEFIRISHRKDIYKVFP
ncbi:MAG: type II toxin-antitoxin system RelE/ParE family toxin [Mucilaginibacter sp.]